MDCSTSSCEQATDTHTVNQPVGGVSRGVPRNLEKGGGKEMSKFVVTPTVSSRLLLRETVATHANFMDQ